jgi:hypothetical protein
MAKSRAQQAAIAISMKKAGKKPKSMPKAQRGAAVDSLWKTAKVTPARMSTGYPEGMSKPKSAPVRMTERPKEMPSNLKNRKLTTDPVSGGIQYKTGGSTPAWTRKEGKKPKSLTKAQKGITVKPTADSTAYYKRASESFMRLANSENKKGNEALANKLVKLAKSASENKKRQALKGQPGYDKNGFPISKKKIQTIKRA